MIDPLEAFIQFLFYRSELAALNKQIGRSYDKAWTPGSDALVIGMDDGSPEDYVPVHAMRFEARCLSADMESAMDTWLALCTISRATDREPVKTGSGTCLLYSFLKASGPSRIFDPDLRMWNVSGFWNVNISEVTV